jgi:hypothetical protein
VLAPGLEGLLPTPEFPATADAQTLLAALATTLIHTGRWATARALPFNLCIHRAERRVWGISWFSPKALACEQTDEKYKKG